MQIRYTFSELEKAAARRYEQWIASLPEPKVVNVEALVAFTVPRRFDMGGVGLRAPPLPFLAGIRLFVAANALRDLRGASARPAVMQDALRTTVRLILQQLHPTSRFRRLTGWRRSFFVAPPEEIEGIARWLLHVPDDSTIPPPKGQVTVDFMGNLCDFVREWPAWVARPGPWWRRGPVPLPVSWAAYVYGSRHLSRARAREDLRRAFAVRFAGADEKHYKAFNAELRQVAGW